MSDSVVEVVVSGLQAAEFEALKDGGIMEQCPDCNESFTDDHDWVEHLAAQHPGAWERWYHARWREQVQHRSTEAAHWR